MKSFDVSETLISSTAQALEEAMGALRVTGNEDLITFDQEDVLKELHSMLLIEVVTGDQEDGSNEASNEGAVQEEVPEAVEAEDSPVEEAPSV